MGKGGAARPSPPNPAIIKQENLSRKTTRDYNETGCAKALPGRGRIKKTLEVFQTVAGNEIRKHKPEEFYDGSFVRELDETGYIDSLYK